MAAAIPKSRLRYENLQRSRIGKRPITFWVNEEVRWALKELGAQRRREIQELMEEALNDLFHKYGRPRVA